MHFCNKTNIIRTTIIIAISFFLMAFFYYCIPLTIDDYFWGGESGMQLLKSVFSDYNGRYLGNILAILLIRIKILRVIIMPSILLGLCYSISIFVVGRFNVLYYCASLSLFLSLVFLPNISIFAQTIAWISGFSNYVSASFLIIVYLNIVKKDIITTTVKHHYSLCILAAILGLCSCLFLENITIACLGISFLVNLFWIIRKKQLCDRNICYFFGALVGAVIMFSNSSYWKMLVGEYSDGRGSGFRGIGLLSFSSNHNMIFLIIFLIVFAACLVIPIISLKNRQNKVELYSIAFTIFMVTIPLLFTNGGNIQYFSAFRIYFPQITLSVLFVLRWLSMMKPRIPIKGVIVRVLNWSQIVACFLVCICAIGIYYKIHIVERDMEGYLELQRQTYVETIQIIEFPEEYSNYIHEINSFKYGWDKEFKSYYNIDENAKLVFISYEHYLYQYPQLKPNS